MSLFDVVPEQHLQKTGEDKISFDNIRRIFLDQFSNNSNNQDHLSLGRNPVGEED